jgi:UDP-glucuronate decarboxylase
MILGLVSMMETGPDIIGPINLGKPEELSIRALAELILELTGSCSKIVHRPLPPDDPQKRRPDISEAERLLDWRPTTPLKEGLAKTIPYFEQLLAEGKIPSAPSMTGAEGLGSAVQR